MAQRAHSAPVPKVDLAPVLGPGKIPKVVRMKQGANGNQNLVK
jgi:hypothetical protein